MQKKSEGAAYKPDVNSVRDDTTLLLCKKSQRFALRSDQTSTFKALLHDVFKPFHKKGLAGKSRKILQRSEWNPDKD